MPDKTAYLQIKLTPKEKDTIQCEADKLGISMAAFLLLLVRQWSDGIRFEKRPNGNNNL